MSIIFIDDVLFNDNEEERKIRSFNCILFLVLNSLSVLAGLFYLYFYFIIPYYQNSSNTLSLYLSIFHVILNIFYFLIFLDIFVFKSIDLSILIKIIIMFNPLIIFCIYYWVVCLTHNLYVLFYKYNHNIKKRVKFYKYLLFIISLIFYIYTLLNIQYNDSQILLKTFGLIHNYKKSFIELFYICGMCMILYIIFKLYYIINKKEDFISVNEYQENQEKKEKIKNIFNSVVIINLSFIIYFLITFTPSNICMLFKYSFFYSNMNTYLIDFITILLISSSGTFIFCIRLLDPFMRTIIINSLLLNREFISNYKKNLLEKKSLNEPFNKNEIYNIYEDNFSGNKLQEIKQMSKLRKFKTSSKIEDTFNFGKNKNEEDEKNNEENEKPFGISKIISKKANINKNFEMINLAKNNKDNNSSISEHDYEENQESEGSQNDIEIGEKDKDKEDDKEKIQNEINSIIINDREKSGIDVQNENSKNNLNISIKSLDRNRTINSSNDLNQENDYKSLKLSVNSNFKSLTKSQNDFFSMNQRANTTMGILKKKSENIKLTIRKRNNSKNEQNALEEEISSFDLMNFHSEMNDNLIRLIAISLSLNECRMYDDIKEYKKYYNSTIPWNNKDFYKERTLFKEYNENTIPSWLGLKNVIKNHIHFKILSFCPFVFHHIRLMDNISIDDILSSLDPINNIKKIQDMKVSGGRGGNSIIYSWDKKFILKTTDTPERKILVEKMIVDYHCLMKESRSLLSRIYGVFKIELEDKGAINVIIQRNMNDLPKITKLLCFDFKGSTVDRQSINKEDIKLGKEELMNKYKNTVLKDLDLGIIGMDIVLNVNDWEKLLSAIDGDSMFLQNYQITDYSLLVFVHKYRKEDIIKYKNCLRIFPSKDKKYIFNFSIVDFLGTFNFEKKGEKLAKELVGYIKKLKDKNFSVLDPDRYGKRFRNFTKRIILDG